MRTTVAIDDELLEQAKDRARSDGCTLGQLIEGALRRDLARQPAGDAPTIPVFRGGTGPRPGVDLTSNRALTAALDNGLELDQLR